MLCLLALAALLATQVVAQDAYSDPDSMNDGTTTSGVGEYSDSPTDQTAYTTATTDTYVAASASTAQSTTTSPLGQPLPAYVQIKFAADPSKCLAVFDTSGQPGTPVVLRECDTIEPEAKHETRWLIDETAPSRVISGAFPDPFCLDAGDVNNRVESITISPCDYVNPAHIWQYTFKHLVIYGKTLSLDLAEGDETGGGHLQTWDYTFGNRNQEWNIEDAPQDTPAS